MSSEGCEEHQKEAGLWVKFSESTSMHGLNRAVGSTQVWKRVVWHLLVLGGMTMAVYNLNKTFQEFANYPTSTKVTLEYQNNAPFPAVTICNLNKLRSSLFEYLLNSPVKTKYAEWSGNRTLTAEELAERLELELRSENEDTLLETGHQLTFMLIDCHFNQERCDQDNFTYFYNIKYGNCFSFNNDNIKTKSHQGRTTRSPGSRNGLQLELDIDQEEYMPSTTTTGLKVVVHDRGTFPFPEDDGLVVGPGMATSIGVKRVEIHRKSAPYSQCVESNSEEAMKKDMFANLYNSSYSIKACRKSCLQSKIYQSCGCCDNAYPCYKDFLLGEDTIKNNGLIPFCYQKHATQPKNSTSNCHLSKIKDSARDCEGSDSPCQLPCDETVYTLTVTQGSWPSRAYTKLFFEKATKTFNELNKEFKFDPNSERDLDKVRDNFLKLEVFYEQLNYERIESVPTFDWYRLLGDIGGQLGLWMGFSVLTAVEFIELFFDFVKHAVCCISK